MKGKDLLACTIKNKQNADFCFHGARTLLKYVNTMMGMIDGVRQNEDIECLHRMRVASRRLRSLLPLFSDCLPPKRRARWRKQLRRVTRALGEARDADVQIVCLQEALAACSDDRQRPGLERLLLRFQQQRQAMQAPLVSTLKRLTSRRHINRMEMALRYLLATSQLYATPESACHTYSRSREAIMRRLQTVLATAATIRGPQNSTELHATRITIKRLRYTLQAFAPLYPDILNDAIRTARKLQDVLGNLHDCDVWVETLPQFLEEEKARTLMYFGNTQPFEILVPGTMTLRDQRRQQRVKCYEEFETLWQRAQDKDVWGRLRRALDDPPLPVHENGSASDPGSGCWGPAPTGGTGPTGRHSARLTASLAVARGDAHHARPRRPTDHLRPLGRVGQRLAWSAYQRFQRRLAAQPSPEPARRRHRRASAPAGQDRRSILAPGNPGAQKAQRSIARLGRLPRTPLVVAALMSSDCPRSPITFREPS